MAEFLLIHGSGHGAWCWRDLLPELAALGHHARAIDLPGNGADTTPPAQVTLAGCVGAIAAALGEPTILVGHSLGGATITAAAARASQHIARLVYLAAWVPGDGARVADLRARHDCAALVAATRPAPDGHSLTFDDAALDALFYHDCPPEARAFARANLCPQPTAIANTPVPARHTLPRSYIACRHDAAIPFAAQQGMSGGWPARDRHILETGHSPFFAAPRALARTLDRIATTPDHAAPVR